MRARAASPCGTPDDSYAARTVALVTAGLASHAITHGRDFRLTLRLLPEVVRIEVTDTRPERLLPTCPVLLLIDGHRTPALVGRPARSSPPGGAPAGRRAGTRTMVSRRVV